MKGNLILILLSLFLLMLGFKEFKSKINSGRPYVVSSTAYTTCNSSDTCKYYSIYKIDKFTKLYNDTSKCIYVWTINTKNYKIYTKKVNKDSLISFKKESEKFY